MRGRRQAVALGSVERFRTPRHRDGGARRSSAPGPVAQRARRLRKARRALRRLCQHRLRRGRCAQPRRRAATEPSTFTAAEAAEVRSRTALPRRANRRRIPPRPTVAPGVSRTSCPVPKTQDNRMEKSHGAATGRRAFGVSHVAAVHRARPPTMRARSTTERKPGPAAGLGSVGASSQKHRACAVRRA